MGEPRDNIRFICKEDMERKRIHFTGDIATLAGKDVKLAFQSPRGEIEHMWVRVTLVDTEEGTLVGLLNNDPLFCTYLKCGDTITHIKAEDVEEIFTNTRKGG